jgi:hypothetical protein
MGHRELSYTENTRVVSPLDISGTPLLNNRVAADVRAIMVLSTFSICFIISLDLELNLSVAVFMSTRGLILC